MNKEMYSLIFMIVIVGLVIIAFYVVPPYYGYHLEWSWINGKYIWVK